MNSDRSAETVADRFADRFRVSVRIVGQDQAAGAADASRVQVSCAGWSLERLTVSRYDDVNMDGDVSIISMNTNSGLSSRNSYQYNNFQPKRATHPMTVPASGDFGLDLQNVAFPGNHLVQHRIDKESDEEAGDEAGDDDDGERPLCIRSNAGGEGSRQ